jgi:hypothetical protein
MRDRKARIVDMGFMGVSFALFLLVVLLLRNASAFLVARLVVRTPARAVARMRMKRKMKKESRVADAGRGLML